MLRNHRKTRSRARFSKLAACGWLLLEASGTYAANVVHHEFIQLDLHPRVCTLAAADDKCDAVVQAQWRSPRDESLCLVIVGRPQIKHCWEHYSEGIYSVELSFTEDLIVELRDPQLQRVLVAEVVTVIKEALRLRHKRRQPWNILY